MGVVTATILSSGVAMNPAFQLVNIDVVKEANRIPYATLTLLDGEPAKQTFPISDDSFFEPGKEIEIKLRHEGEPSSEASVFKGLVIKQVVEAKGGGTWLTVEMKDTALKMTQTRRSAVYTQQSDSEIFGVLIGKYNLKRGKLATTQSKHPEIVQYYCTDWDFLLSRADLYGLMVIAENGEISIREINFDGNPKITFEFGITEIFGFEIEVDGSHQYASVESIAWDPQSQKLTQASRAKSFTVPQGNLHAPGIANLVGGKVQSLSSAVPLDPRTLQAWADGAMIKSRFSMIRGTISTAGNGKLQRMDVIEVAGVGDRFNGKTVVTGVRHRVDQNGWQTDVQFGFSADRYSSSADVMDRPAAGLVPGVNGLQIGLVSDIEDPDKGSRVKVILPGIDEKKGEVWARLAAPDAGKGRGFFFRPEKGDEVVVGFFNDDPRQAVILGAMYSSKNTPPDALAKDSKNNVGKGIVSRAGTSLTFSDQDKPSVILQTPAANKITLDDDGQKIEIKDQHGNTITMSKDGITIKSAKDFTIDASGNVAIKGSKVDVK